MATKGQGMGEDMDDQILAPYTTVQKKLLGINNVQTIIVSASTAEGTKGVADAIAVLLRTRRSVIGTATRHCAMGAPWLMRSRTRMVSRPTASIGISTLVRGGSQSRA